MTSQICRDIFLDAHTSALSIDLLSDIANTTFRNKRWSSKQ